MSAPIVACAIADAMGPLLKALSESMSANTRIDWFPASDRCHSFWNAQVHVHNQCFAGSDNESPSRALMNANADRQAWEQQNYCPGHCARGEEHYGSDHGALAVAA